MKWEGNRESDNVEDMRESGGGGGFPMGRRGIGIGTIVIALLGSWVLGINPMTLLGLLSGGGGGGRSGRTSSAGGGSGAAAGTFSSGGKGGGRGDKARRDRKSHQTACHFEQFSAQK